MLFAGQNTSRRQRGFSLLEVLVAFSILAASLSVLFAIFSKGLQSASLTAEYKQAVSLAQREMGQLLVMDVLRAGVHEGSADPYQWRATIEPSGHGDTDDDDLLRAFDVTIDVSWREGRSDRRVSVSTVALAGR